MATRKKLTDAQMRIHHLDNMYSESNGNAMIVMGAGHLGLDFDEDILKKAINMIVKKSDIFRMSIFDDNGKPWASISDYEWIDIPVIHFNNEKEKSKWEKEEVNRKIPLSRNKLWDIWISVVEGHKYGVEVKFHHIISDAWSIITVFNMVRDFYHKIIAKIAIDCSELNYFDVSDKKQEKYFGSSRYAKDEQYWISMFNDFERANTIKPIETNFSIEAKRLTKSICGNEYKEIIDFCKDKKITTYAFFLGTLQLILGKYRGTQDISLGTILLNRNNKNEKATPGMFVSTIALRQQLNEDTTFENHLNNMSSTIMDLFRHQQYPYNHLLERLRSEYNITNELYDVVLSYQNASIMGADDNDVTTKWIFNNSSFNALTIHVNDRDNRGELIIDYDFQTNHLTKNEIESFHDYYLNIMKWGINNYRKQIWEVSLLTEKQQTILLEESWGEITNSEYETLIDRYEHVLKVHMNDIALKDGDNKYTYKQLDALVNRLANYLEAHGVSYGDNVLVVMTGTWEFVISVLAIMKCGAVYVPVDEKYPEDRINYIVKNSRSDIVLCNNNKVFQMLKESVSRVINVSEIPFSDYREEYQRKLITSTDLAYIIYTSGTTGAPKGVVLNQNNVVNYINWAIDTYVENGRGNMPLFTSISFDLTVTSLFVPLLSGSTIIAYHHEDIHENIKRIFGEGMCHIIKMTPSHLSIVNKVKCHNITIHTFILGGEELKENTAYEIYNQFNKKIQIYNEYGPTEATVGCMCYLYTGKDMSNKGMPIGRPIDNTAIYIMDEKQHLLPHGIAGEIYIAGDGIATGYYCDAKKTDNNFFENPIRLGEKIYQTGDSALVDNSGTVRYLGRKDRQIKIRGYRIELQEIENVVMSIPQIKKAIVTKVRGDESLVLYYSVEADISTQEIRSVIREMLPFYMVPSYYMEVHSFPITINGKLDYTALPTPNENHMVKALFVVAETMFEKEIIDIWKGVLCVNNISINDDFFDLGGHSLSAIEIVNLISKNLDITIEVSDVFKYRTVHSLAECLEKKEKNDHNLITQYDTKKLSDNELRMFSAWQMDEESTQYNMPVFFDISGQVDILKLKESLLKLIVHNASLRTNYLLLDGIPLVQVLDEEFVKKTFNVIEFDIEGRSKKDVIDTLRRPFNLSNDLLLRSAIGYEDGNAKWLFIDIHHIASDGISNEIYMQKLVNFYREEPLFEDKMTYREYAGWDQMRLQDKKYIKKGIDFWNNMYSDEITDLNLRSDYRVPRDTKEKSGKCFINLSADVSRLHKLIKENKVTMFTLLFGTYAILLGKYAQKSNLVIGIPYSGRDSLEFERVTGYFAKTLPIRVNLGKNKLFSDFLKDVQNNLHESFSSSQVSFEKIAKIANSHITSHDNLLCDVMFTYSPKINNRIQLNKTEALIRSQEDFSIEKFDFTFQVFEGVDGIDCQLSYNANLYSKASMMMLLNCYKNLVTSICSDSNKSIDELTIISTNEVLNPVNKSQQIKSKHHGETISQCFEKIVEKKANKIAVVFQNETLTYSELNRRANRVANYLRKRGIKRNQIVGIMLDKSLEMIIAIFGIIKAGAAYLPIDVENPTERINYILSDSNAKLVISSDKYKQYFTPKKYIDLQIVQNSICNEDAPVCFNESEDIAYVIYTSGTTGLPKGTLMMHRNALAIAFEDEKIGAIETDHFLQLCNYAFDVSVGEILCALLNGATLHIAHKDLVFDSNQLGDYIVKNKITFIFFTTAIFNLLVDCNVAVLENLRRFSIGGEKASVKHMNKAFRVVGPGKVMNAYGPTETTVLSHAYILDKEIDLDLYSSVPIGNGVAYSQTYVMDKNMSILPDGATGELVIGGDGVGRGYLNNNKLTSKKFVQDPSFPQNILYRTGDLVRKMSNGNLDFIGRIDNQIKIRGFRVELSEIEKQIGKFDDIQDVVVVSQNDKKHNVKDLIAYVVSDKELDIEYIKQQLHQYIPNYMVPTYIYKIDRIPLTTNGKVDQKKLQTIVINEQKRNSNAKAETKIQSLLLDCWKNVLDIDDIGIDDRFIESGGDSIKAIQISSMLQKHGFELKVKDVLGCATIREQSKMITSISNIEGVGNAIGEVIATPIISKFVEEYGDIPSHFNQSLIITNERMIEKKILTDTLSKICEIHDVLRSTWNNGTLQVHDNAQEGFKLCEILLKNTMEKERENIEAFSTEFQRDFKLQDGPLFKVALIRCDDKDLLLFCLHHLVIDGMSWRILIEDFVKYYSSYLENKTIQEVSKTTSLKSWAESVYEYAQSDNIKNYYDYWKKQVEQIRQGTESYAVKRKVSQLSCKKRVVNENNTSLITNNVGGIFDCSVADILLAIMCKAYAKVFNKQYLSVSIENNGRQILNEKHSLVRTVGWFTAMYPQFIDMTTCVDHDYILHVKECMHNVPNSGFEYNVLKYISEDNYYDTSDWHFSSDINFNYLGEFDNGNVGDFHATNHVISNTIDGNMLQNSCIEMNGMLQNKQINMEFTYLEDEISSCLIDEFMNCFEKEIENIISICLSTTKPIYSISDYVDDSLTVEELDELNSLF